jgi:coproporphyrinogen III oxidase
MAAAARRKGRLHRGGRIGKGMRRMSDAITDWSEPTDAARAWFEALRDRICGAFETLEREAGSEAAFAYSPWQREEAGNPDPGGGVRGVMKGRVFEKVGVNVSTVRGRFAADFAGTIHGAGTEAPGFTATGISLVAHMANPHVPAVHMNTRFLTTTRAWFGGGADLNPPLPYEEDTAEFHATFRAACMKHNPTYYDRFSRWAEEYFFIPHRGVARGVGGIFYDHLECGDLAAFERNFAFTRDIGEAFLAVFPDLVRRRMATPFTAEDKRRQLEWRGRYAEFNLVYDRGTLFGLRTGGNVDAILMSLPPEATWA